jgi:magnesium chelatase family protein
VAAKNSVGQAAARSVALVGLDAHLVEVEVDSARGVSNFRMVGLPEAAVRESQARVRAALCHLGVLLGEYNLTVNLAPADLRKTGSCFDLAIALGILGAIGTIEPSRLTGLIFVGELSLTGEVRPVRGVLPALLGAAARGERAAIVPRDNGAEAASIERVSSYAAATLRDVVEHLCGEATLERATPATPKSVPRRRHAHADLAEVRGQAAGRRLLEVAAAGGHNLLMMGPPGAGKTMLARRLPTILPPMTSDEALEVTAVHSVAGLLRRQSGLLAERPFRAPHHSISAAALLGGGSPLRPGEVSLAHHGCLFLDEVFEFPRAVLEGLRQPLEDGLITVCRARERAEFPARALLVAAVNPCPCGYFGDPRDLCDCGKRRVEAYQSRLSGPLLDRIDLQLVLEPVGLDQLQSADRGESSAIVAERVARARQVQAARHARGEVSARINATLTVADLDRVAQPTGMAMGLLRTAVDHLRLSARGYTKVRRVARTFADLDGSAAVQPGHFREAVDCRKLDLIGSPRRGARAA